MRNRKVFAFFLILVLFLNLAACQPQGKRRFEAQFITLFDTVTQIVAYMESKEEFTSQVNQIYQDLEEYHRLFDIYHSYPGIVNIKTINDHAGRKPIKVDHRIIDLLLFAVDIYYKTEGQVNVALGPILSIWHEYRENAVASPEDAILPPLELLKEAAEHTDITKVMIDQQASTVFLEDFRMSLDVGAIAKGYAVEQVSEKAAARGFSSGLISVGGNVKAMGLKGFDGSLWNVGIQNPDLPGEESNLHVLYLFNQSLVTSGNYVRYFTIEGKKYHHIIDPDTLFPAEYFNSVTIICEDSGVADGLATGIFNLSLEKGMALIESLPEVEAFWVLMDGEQKFSSGFPEFI